jgi:lipid A 3-O-deacylase
MRTILAAAIAALAAGTGAYAADLTRSPVVAPPIPVLPQPAPGFISELRLGVSAQDPSGPESGSANLTGEVLSARFFRSADPVLDLFIPRLHLGGSLNLDGETSFGYAGLTWTFDVTPSVFLEASFGGAVHNGETDRVPGHDALGCTALFRESGSLGFRLTRNWSVMGTVEHLSNGGLCSNNRGLTNVGVRVGYTF